MKIKVSEAPNHVIDWAVAKCEGAVSDDVDDFCLSVAGEFAYTTDWSLGGPIIEREFHAFDYMQSKDRVCAIIKRKDMRNGGYDFGYGPTILVAAMRCYVMSKMGDEIDVPDELLQA